MAEPPQKRNVVDELLYGVGQMGAGVVEYLGSSPEARQALPYVGAFVPNAVWMLGGLAQALGNKLSDAVTGEEGPQEPTTLMHFARSGIDSANTLMSDVTGQQIGDPVNLVDTLLREGGLFLMPFGRALTTTKAAASGGAFKTGLKGVGAVLAPGMQARTAGGGALEFGAGVAIADTVEEYFDQPDVPVEQGGYEYTGFRDLVSRDEYPVVPRQKPLSQRVADTFPQKGSLREQMSAAFPDTTSAIMSGELQEVDDEPWVVSNLALSIAGILATGVGGVAAARHYGKARKAFIEANSALFGSTDYIKQQSLKVDDLGKEVHAGFRDAMRTEASDKVEKMFENVRASADMFRSQVHDYNRMLKVDVEDAFKSGVISQQRHDDLVRRIDTIGNEGAIGELTQQTAESGIFPMSGIASRRSIAQILDKVSLLKPQDEIMLNEHLVFRRVLHELEIENAARKARGEAPISSWGIPKEGVPDGEGWYSEALMRRMVNTPLPAHVKQLVDDFDDVMKSTAMWGREQGYLDLDTYKKWMDTPYAPLRYAGQEPHATDFLRSQSTVFDNRVQPGQIMKPTDMLGEYLNTVSVRVLHNRLRRDMLELELSAGRTMPDGRRAFRIVKNPKTDTADMAKAVEVFAHQGLPDMETGKTRTGRLFVVVEDPVRRNLLNNVPTLHGDFINKMDAIRRFSQNITTGSASILTSRFFAPVSAAYEAVTATMFHPKGYSISPTGRALRKLTGDKYAQWDMFLDPVALTNPVSGTVMSLWSDTMKLASRRLRTALDMTDDMVGNVVGQTFDDATAKKLTRMGDRAFVRLYGRANAEALYSRMEKAYLNSSKRIKESLGGGTAPIFGEHMNDVPAMMHKIAPSWSRNTGEFRLLNNPVFRLWDSINEGMHGSTRYTFINSNKTVAVQKARINGREIPVMHRPGVIGYSPDLHELVRESRRLTGNILQRGGVGGTTGGRYMDAWIRSVPYANVGIQVLGRMVEQFRERPLFVAGVLASYAAATQAYIANHILGHPERERVYGHEMGPTQRAYSWYVFDENDEIVGAYAMPHELRMFMSPIIEGMLAANGLTGQTGNLDGTGLDLTKVAWKRFYQDVMPSPVPQWIGVGAGLVAGQAAPDLNFGRFQFSQGQFTENFEADNEELMNRVRVMSDELFLGASTLFLSTIEALHAAAYRDSHDVDWPRLMHDVGTSLTLGLRDERSLPAKILFGQDSTRTNPRTISTYDDPAKIEFKNTLDKMKNWSERIEQRVINPGVFGGEDAYSNPDAYIRDIYNAPIRLGIPNEPDTRLGLAVRMFYRRDPLIQDIKKQLERLDDEREAQYKANSDPVQRKRVLNVISMKEKELYAKGVLYLRHIEEQFRAASRLNPDTFAQFTKFQAMPSWPDSPWFNEPGVGKYDPSGGQPTMVKEYERDPVRLPSFLPNP